MKATEPQKLWSLSANLGSDRIQRKMTDQYDRLVVFELHRTRTVGTSVVNRSNASGMRLHPEIFR